MIMMSRFVQRIINSPPMCYQTAEQRANVDGESYKSQGGWLTVSDDWTCDHKTPRPERGPCSWYWQWPGASKPHVSLAIIIIISRIF